MSLLLKAKAQDVGCITDDWYGCDLKPKSKAQNLEPASDLFRNGCTTGDWFGCKMTVELQKETNNSSDYFLRRVTELAYDACAWNPMACEHLAELAQESQDATVANQRYLQACIRRSGLNHKTNLSEQGCRAAIAAGLSTEEIEQEARKFTKSYPQKIEGIDNVFPKLAWTSNRRPLIAVFMLCISEKGTPIQIAILKTSEDAVWNSRLFEAMRGWKFAPAIDAEGEAQPRCGTKTFVATER